MLRLDMLKLFVDMKWRMYHIHIFRSHVNSFLNNLKKKKKRLEIKGTFEDKKISQKERK